MKKIISAIVLLSMCMGMMPITATAQSDCTTINPGLSYANVLRRVACSGGIITIGENEPEGTQEELVFAIARGTNVVLSFLGVVFGILVVYGGFMWMTAQGNEEQVEKSRTLLRNAVIGLVVVMSAFVVARTILAAVQFGIGVSP